MSDTLGRPKISAEEISDFTRRTNYGTWRVQKTWKPLYITDAEGCWITDSAGKKYLDFSSQLMCVNLGHKNHAVVESITQQARDLAFVGPVYATEARARLSAKLLEVLPTGLEKFFYATSGTEANEAAFKIARMVTGKSKIIALSVLSRFHHGLDRCHWRSSSLGHGTGGQGAARCLCARDELLQVSDQTHLSGLQCCMCGLR